MKLKYPSQECRLWPVAPSAGAWIEIKKRGKLSMMMVSLPPRERGLKSSLGTALANVVNVAPSAGAWIEMNFAADI